MKGTRGNKQQRAFIKGLSCANKLVNSFLDVCFRKADMCTRASVSSIGPVCCLGLVDICLCVAIFVVRITLKAARTLVIVELDGAILPS